MKTKSNKARREAEIKQRTVENAKANLIERITEAVYSTVKCSAGTLNTIWKKMHFTRPENQNKMWKSKLRQGDCLAQPNH